MHPKHLKEYFKDNPETVLFFLNHLAVGIFLFFDVYEEFGHKESLGHILAELIIGSSLILSAIFLGRRLIVGYKERYSDLETTIEAIKDEAKKWREANTQLTKGLAEAIDKQLVKWNLSEAEKDVAKLMLKGLSHKEIADLRGGSEKTVRQHATVIYSKSNLGSRSQLSAFFLEDLL